MYQILCWTTRDEAVKKAAPPCPGGAGVLGGKAAEKPTWKGAQKYQVVRRAQGEITQGHCGEGAEMSPGVGG